MLSQILVPAAAPLLPRSCCADVIHACSGATALMAAAGKGRLEDAAALLTAGADAALKSSDGSTAQDWAARFGHDDLAEFLGTHMQVSLQGASFLTQPSHRSL